MITEKPFLYWYKSKCYIQDGIIYEENHNNRILYEISDETPILEDFLKINEENLIEIENFINKYGFLKHEFINNPSTAVFQEDKKFIISSYSEELQYFIEQVSKLKTIRVLHSIYLSDDPISTLINEGSTIKWSYPILHRFLSRIQKYLDIKLENRSIRSITIKEQNYFTDAEYSISYDVYDNKILRNEAANIMTQSINEEIKNVHPELKLDLDYRINCTWKANSLLEILYIKYYETIISGKELRMCANPKCTNNKYFLVQVDKEKRYCCSKCAMQGMQNEANKKIKDPSSSYYNPKKVAFNKVYNRLYYLYYNGRIDSVKFKTWNEEARKKLKTMDEKDYLKWLDCTGDEKNFYKE